MCSSGAERAMLPTTDGTSVNSLHRHLNRDSEPSFELTGASDEL